jgi:hypothetical protein
VAPQQDRAVAVWATIQFVCVIHNTSFLRHGNPRLQVFAVHSQTRYSAPSLCIYKCFKMPTPIVPSPDS